MIDSYPKIFHLGNHMIGDLFKDPVFIQEKIDGSQFSFGNINGERVFRSKSVRIFPENVDALFRNTVSSIMALMDKGSIPHNVVFRGEAIGANRHNTLCYDRVPKNHIVIFDIQDFNSKGFLKPNVAKNLCEQIELEFVETTYGSITGVHDVLDLMQKPSALGGKREGLVFKNYDRFNRNGEILIGKYVSEEFKEVNKKVFREDNPTKGDIVQRIIQSLATESRWKKAIQHLRESGQITDSPKDIGPLLKEIQRDVFEEEQEYIKNILFGFFWKNFIKGGIIRNFPEWYKQQLMEKQFNEV